MNDRDILSAAGVEMPEPENKSGCIDPRKLGMVFLSANQLKNVSKMLNAKAALMTREEIEREVILNGDKLNATPNEEHENSKKVTELIKHQQDALAEKRKQYKDWEARQKTTGL